MIAVLVFVFALSYGTSLPSDLREYLFKDYDLDQMPASPLDVGFGVKFSHIISVNELMNSIAVSVWVRLTWYDPRLRWEKSKFNNTESIYVPVQATGISSGIIWGPTLRLWNPADAWQPKYETEARVTSEGIVTWSRGENMNIMCTFIGSSFPLKKTKCTLELGAWTNVMEKYYIREDYMDYSLGGAQSTSVAYMIDDKNSKATETTWEGPLDTYHYISLELVVYGFATSKILSVVIPWILQVQTATFYPFFTDEIDPMFLILQVVAACSTLTFSITSENVGETSTHIVLFSVLSFLSIFIFHGLNLATSQYIASRSEKHHSAAHFLTAVLGICVLSVISGYATWIILDIETNTPSVLMWIFSVSVLCGFTMSLLLVLYTGYIFICGAKKKQVVGMMFRPTIGSSNASNLSSNGSDDNIVVSDSTDSSNIENDTFEMLSALSNSSEL